MNLAQGDVVIATAGKEKNQIFVVLKVESGFAWLVDGKRLKISKPKKKSLKHVQKASKIGFDAEELKSGQENVNSKLRKFLKERSLYVQGRCD
jgi:ribosomal protein L14E/L6E/L27E